MILFVAAGYLAGALLSFKAGVPIGVVLGFLVAPFVPVPDAGCGVPPPPDPPDAQPPEEA